MFERFTNRAREAVTRAQAVARDMGHDRVGTEHLLLALIRDEASLAARVLRGTGLEFDVLRDDVERAISQAQILGEADAAALREIGIDLDTVRAKVEEAFGAGALREPEPEPRRWRVLRRRAPRIHTPFSPRARKVLELSLREALRLKHHYIGTEHILLGLIREGEGLAALVLTRAGVNLGDLRQRVLEALRTAA